MNRIVSGFTSRRIFLIWCFSISLISCLWFDQRATGQAMSAASAASKQAVADETWARLMEGNHRFIAGHSQAHDVVALRRQLATGQHPKAIVLACSDSRVAPELLFDQSLGDLFVVRSAGNVADAIGMGSIEYAAEHLGATLLVVLGHQKCGAVTAACSGNRVPSPNLQAILDRISPAVVEARTHVKNSELVEAAVRQNVLQSANDLLAGSEELRHAVHDGKLEIVEAVYSLDSGEVSFLGKLPAHE